MPQAAAPRVFADSGGSAEVTLNCVSYSYDTGVQALSSLSLDIEHGRTLGVVGPSGCGKSTLLFLLAGIYVPDEGSITWASAPSIDAKSESKHKLSMVFQKDTLLPWRTVTQNIELYARFTKGPDKHTVRERTKELISLGSLDGFERAYPYQLSGGMRRRAVFLGAVAPSPQVLLLDEPFSAVDEPTRVGIHQDVFDILKRDGTTAVLVTHDLAEAISLCDRVVILTNRPGTVHAVHPIPFGVERNMLDLRHEPEFLELYGRLWEDLESQIGARRPNSNRDSATKPKAHQG